MSFEVPNLTLLRHFVVVAEEKGISKAAKRLRISQPALSKNIRKLEDVLGTQLFERHSGGSDLTATLMARCLKADAITLWKDVAGFLTADPRIVSDAHVIPQLTPAETRDAQAAGATLLDVREPVETAAGVIAGSVLVPLGYVLNDPAAVSASLEGPVVVVCKVGARAQHAAAALRAVGLDAAVLAGGIEAWNRETAG